MAYLQYQDRHHYQIPKRNGIYKNQDPPEVTCPYSAYYLAQVGGAMPVYRGARYQKGYGFGGVFAKMYRHATPLFTRGAKYLGKQALYAGKGIAQDVFSGQTLRTATRNQLKRTGQEFVNDAVQYMMPQDQSGSGSRKRKRVQKRKPPARKRRKMEHPDNIF